MTEHTETRIVPYTADLMYTVVADVERYPEFLFWVADLRVLSHVAKGPRATVTAEMEVVYGAFRERYTSRVSLDPSERAIDVIQTSGPFRLLENHWRFTPKGESCEIEFSIAFAFRNRLLGAVAGAVFERVLMRIADAFEARAKALSQQSV